MEFHETLQTLRKQKGLTQEELAAALFVSRTAVSKWESGRGYPSIDSLKAIAAFFDVTVDRLLSGEELLCVAQEDARQQRGHIRDLVFGLLDVSTAACLFLPIFGQHADGAVQAVSLLALSGVSLWLKGVYLTAVVFLVIWGVLTLTLQSCHCPWWERHKSTVAVVGNALGTLLFIIGSQPYAATLLFMFLIIKVLLLFKKP